MSQAPTREEASTVTWEQAQAELARRDAELEEGQEETATERSIRMDAAGW